MTGPINNIELQLQISVKNTHNFIEPMKQHRISVTNTFNLRIHIKYQNQHCVVVVIDSMQSYIGVHMRNSEQHCVAIADII